MSKTRAREISIFSYVEPSIYALMNVACKASNLSISSYIRNLIIKDLSARGIITENLAGRLTKESIETELEAALAAHAEELAQI